MKILLTICALLTFGTGVFALTLAPVDSLEKRLDAAKLVFVGKIINRSEDGEWVQAELLVEDPVLNIKKGGLVPVIWRKTAGGTAIYDAQEGLRGLAILDGYHKGRYWLRSDRFEDVALAAEAKRIIAARDEEEIKE